MVLFVIIDEVKDRLFNIRIVDMSYDVCIKGLIIIVSLMIEVVLCWFFVRIF